MDPFTLYTMARTSPTLADYPPRLRKILAERIVARNPVTTSWYSTVSMHYTSSMKYRWAYLKNPRKPTHSRPHSESLSRRLALMTSLRRYHTRTNHTTREVERPRSLTKWNRPAIGKIHRRWLASIKRLSAGKRTETDRPDTLPPTRL